MVRVDNTLISKSLSLHLQIKKLSVQITTCVRLLQFSALSAIPFYPVYLKMLRLWMRFRKHSWIKILCYQNFFQSYRCRNKIQDTYFLLLLVHSKIIIKIILVRSIFMRMFTIKEYCLEFCLWFYQSHRNYVFFFDKHMIKAGQTNNFCSYI